MIKATFLLQRQIYRNIGLYPNKYASEQEECGQPQLLFALMDFCKPAIPKSNVFFKPICLKLHSPHGKSKWNKKEVNLMRPVWEVCVNVSIILGGHSEIQLLEEQIDG